MTVSFKTDILPLFTSMDVEHMSRARVSLDGYAYMSQRVNASDVYEKVSTAAMPRATAASALGRRTKFSCSKRGWTAATQP